MNLSCIEVLGIVLVVFFICATISICLSKETIRTYEYPKKEDKDNV